MNYPFIIPLLTTAVLEQTTFTIVRVTTSYRAVELGLSVVWLGVLTAVIATLPLLLAVQVGRYIDRGNEKATALLGSGLAVLASGGFVLWPTLTGLLIFTALIGLGHLMLVISQQVLCASDPRPGALERNVGNYMLANAIGQGLGPYIVGHIGGDASVPPTQFLFLIAFLGSFLTFAVTLLLRPGGPRKQRTEKSGPMPLRDILRLPGMRVILFVGVTVVSAQEMIVVYLPFLGAERGVAVELVGWLLAARALASVLSRFLFARLHQIMGHRRLMLTSVLISALFYAAMALPMPFVLLLAVVSVAGFALGIAITATIAALLNLATPDTRGTANSLRIMGNRAGQLVIPFSVGMVAAATGAAGIFVIIGASLAFATAVMALQKPRTQ
ncbi:MAG: MFS transporter [Hyphomicrobiales bacterium]|nr:MFS transporter [Hyphomicrobiales bacterium]